MKNEKLEKVLDEYRKACSKYEHEPTKENEKKIENIKVEIEKVLDNDK